MQKRSFNPAAAQSIQRRYLAALLEPDASVASEAIQDGLLQFGATRLYLDVFAPSLVEMGALWSQGEINIAQEHLATQTLQGHLERLKQTLCPTSALDRHAVVTAVQGEHHTIGPRIVADLLHFDGWQVDFLGADTPTADLVEFVQQRQANLVALSVTLEDHISTTIEAIALLRDLDPAPQILVGGLASGGLSKECAESEVAIADCALEGVEAARRLAGLEKQTRGLDSYLRTLGQRVQALRKSRGWSQQYLANQAGLDRTYLSSVEHGKRNLTLSVVLKLAHSLGVPLEALLSQSFLAASAVESESDWVTSSRQG